MSFLSDLFEGNFSNLGTDITDAPSSFVTDWSSEAPYVEGAGALAGAALLGPEVAPLFAGLDGAAAAAPASLDAANAAFGTFDPASLAADTAAAGADGAAAAGDTAASLATDAGTLPSADVAAALPAADGALPPDATAFAPSASGTDGSLSSFLANPTGGDGGALAYNPSGSDGAALLDQTNAGLPGGSATDILNAPPGAPTAGPTPPGGGTLSAADQALLNQTGAGLPGGSATNAISGTIGPPTGADGGIMSTLNSALSSPATRIGLGLAPLGIALAMGEAQLPSSAQQAQANAAVLSQFGQANINGNLNAGQMATLQVMQQNLTNQVRQQLYNMGVQNPAGDSRYTQMMAWVDTQVTAATANMINQNITQALSALGSAGTQLNQIAQMQMTADQNFTNTLVNATKSLGLLAGTNFAGGKTTTTTTTTGTDGA
jgi:hypothetical protein